MNRIQIAALATLLALLLPLQALAQGQRWYQIEVSIFTHETGDPAAEHWTAERVNPTFPQGLRVMGSVLDALDLEDWSVLAPPAARALRTDTLSGDDVPGNGEEEPEPPIPGPQGEHNSDFRLPDIQRDPFLRLPENEQNFRTTNQRLDNSPAHRLLWHAAWRQPMGQRNQATALAIAEGRAFETDFGLRHELEGSLSLYFNAPENRVVLDANLWLTEFVRGSRQAPEPLPGRFQPLLEQARWQLPELPAVMRERAGGEVATAAEGHFRIERIIPMRQQRDMRSNEFHYLDHPALGIVVEVFPYQVPALDGPAPMLLPDSDSGLP